MSPRGLEAIKRLYDHIRSLAQKFLELDTADTQAEEEETIKDQ